MEKGKFTFTKEDALQEVGNLIEVFKEMKIVNLGNDTYNVIGVPVTNIEQEIRNVFQRAGELLYCDKIAVYDFHKTEGDCYLYYRREKHIDGIIRNREAERLFDMLRMGFDDSIGWVSFTDIATTSDSEYDIIVVTFELGIKAVVTEIS